MTMDYARLASLIKVEAAVAKRIWEIWIMSGAFSHPTDELTAEQNRFLAFASESGLPDDASRKYIKACREYEAIRARN